MKDHSPAHQLCLCPSAHCILYSEYLCILAIVFIFVIINVQQELLL